MARKANAQKILDAIRELYEAGALPSRESVLDVLEQEGITLQQIDSVTRELVDCGELIRIQRGVWMPTEDYKPPRLMSFIRLPSGGIKIEIGDDICFLLTPREKRMLGEILGGAALQYASVDAARQMSAMLAQAKPKKSTTVKETTLQLAL